MYDDYDHYDEDGCYEDEDDFDCGWTFELGQLCDDAGSESCSFFCPHHKAMMDALGDNPRPPTWAQKAEWFKDDDDA